MRKKRTFEDLHDRALKYQRRGDFASCDPAACECSRRRGKEFFDLICSHMDIPLNEAYSFEEIKSMVSKCKKRSDFEKLNAGAYHAAKRRPDFEEICANMDVPMTEAYSLEEIIAESSKHKTPSAFKKSNPSIYNAARKRYDFSKICSHMDHSNNESWSREELDAEVLPHSTVNAFRKSNPTAYHAASKRSDFEDILKNLKRLGTISDSEIELFDIIKQIHPTAQKLRSRVNILDKPHIHRFDIDIYVKELSLGIEFDGSYWHSFEGLKRSRPKWPDEDLCNYHSLKDGHFLSKGIQILHIRWEDWIADKQACIQRCLDFLSGAPCP